jgi:lipopolysaccharide transport system ATP-binding protein
VNTTAAIQIDDLSKKYALGRAKESNLRHAIGHLFKSKQTSEEFWALDGINLTINKGDVVGIIGKNGAGKSTLLKILSQITKPTTGTVRIDGRIASLLEVGTGFHPELTGRENIYLNGTILGMTRREVKEKFDEIIAFSEVEKFIDTPVKHYSSGMYVRLAFAVAAHLEPEILIIDEVLAVGDAEFQKKCLGKMKDVSNDGRTVLFVSHHLGSVRQLCNVGVLMRQGKIITQGSIENVISTYQKVGGSSLHYENKHSEKPVFVEHATFLNETNEICHNEDIRIELALHNPGIFNNNIKLLLRVCDELNNVIFSTESEILNLLKFNVTIPSSFLVKGNYKINSILYRPGIAQYENIEELLTFEILDNTPQFCHLETFDIGKVYSQSKWIIR